MKGLSEFRAHLNHQVALLLEAGLPLFGGIFDHLLKLSPIDRIEDVGQPLAVHVVPVSLVRQVLQCILGLLCQLKHILNSKALYLRDSGNYYFITFDVLVKTLLFPLKPYLFFRFHDLFEEVYVS